MIWAWGMGAVTTINGIVRNDGIVGAIGALIMAGACIAIHFDKRTRP